MSNFYVYGHIDIKTNLPFYIGKGTGDRAFRGLNERHIYWNYFVNKYAADYRVVFLAENMDEESAYFMEGYFISKFGQIMNSPNNTLVNWTPGGINEGSNIIIGETGEMTSTLLKFLTKDGHTYLNLQLLNPNLTNVHSFLNDIILEQEIIQRQDIISKISKKGKPLKPIILPFSFTLKVKSQDKFTLQSQSLNVLLNEINSDVDYSKIMLPKYHDNLLTKVSQHFNSLLMKFLILKASENTSVINKNLLLRQPEKDNYIKLIKGINLGITPQIKFIGEHPAVKYTDNPEKLFIYNFEVSFT
jgi:hypothetical protein